MPQNRMNAKSRRDASHSRNVINIRDSINDGNNKKMKGSQQKQKAVECHTTA
jgi:hypothetical protein